MRLFAYSLRDREISWLNFLEPNSIATWNALAEIFLAKYFPFVKNARMRNKITSLWQGCDESLFDACDRFKELLRHFPHHGIPIYIQLETFCNGLVPSSRTMLDSSSGGELLSKSYEEGYKLIERINSNTYKWPVTRATTVVVPKKLIGVHEVTETTTLV